MSVIYIAAREEGLGVGRGLVVGTEGAGVGHILQSYLELIGGDISHYF